MPRTRDLEILPSADRRWTDRGKSSASISVILADTIAAWRETYGELFDSAFHIISVFFIAQYLVRLIAAAGFLEPVIVVPGGHGTTWALSIGGIFGYLAALPGVLKIALDTEDAILLLSVLLGVVVVLLAASSLEYLFERAAQPDAFGSIPAALWWGIVTMTNTAYGDSVP